MFLKDFRVNVINIGNELLIGKTLNTNLTWLANELTVIGLKVNNALIVPDEVFEISQAIEMFWAKSDVLIITGGLGPTKDDLTKQCIADYFNKKLIFMPEIAKDIEERFKKRNIEMPESNNCQAYVPEDFVYLHNSLGTAPGLKYQDANKTLFCLPGVPFEMKHLYDVHIREYLVKNKINKDFFCEDIHTVGLPESLIADKMSSFLTEQGVNIAWLPKTGRVDIRVYGDNFENIQKSKEHILRLFSKNVWGINETTPQDKLGRLLKSSDLTISTAESCTGGMISALLTDIKGASGYYKGSVIAYANDVKKDILGVSESILFDHGAVSTETLEQMLTGCERLFRTDLVCGVTGIAGPDGGTEAKPVGTVYIGIRYKQKNFIKKFLFTGNRELIRFKTAEMAVLMLIDLLESKC